MIKSFKDRWLWVATVVLFGAAPQSQAAEDYLPFEPTMVAGAACTVDARTVHPTQFTLGWREVVYKAALFDGKSEKEIVKYLKKKDVPLVIGPGGVPYVTDGHHTLRGLIAAQRADKTAYGHVLANWATLEPTEFWRRMVAANYAYLRDASGTDQPADRLPATLATMARDPYRGLTWALKEAEVFTELKDVYFQEFFWADYLRDKVKWNDDNDADFARAVAAATRLAQAPEAQHLPGAKTGH
jgi:hypothetical protein